MTTRTKQRKQNGMSVNYHRCGVNITIFTKHTCIVFNTLYIHNDKYITDSGLIKVNKELM